MDTFLNQNDDVLTFRLIKVNTAGKITYEELQWSKKINIKNTYFEYVYCVA